MDITVNPSVIRWAAKRSGISEEQICKKFKKYPEWISQTSEPTLSQLMQFANMVHVKLCDFYAPTIPDYGLRIADFRTLDSHDITDPSPDLYDTISLIKQRQDWLKEYFILDEQEKIPLVGCWKDTACTKENVTKLAEYLREYLELSSTWAYTIKTQNEAVRTLRDAIERKGISVAINGVVGDNTHRQLNVDEFRGFVLSDSIAPIIFINNQDAKGAQLFTMAHELAHLALAKTGVINPLTDKVADNSRTASIEQFCDMVAAEFLVSSKQLSVMWQNAIYQKHSLFDTVCYIAKLHKVTFMVVARQAKHCLLISDKEFFELYHKHVEALSTLVPKTRKSGGNAYFVKAYRLGTVFSEAVWSAFNSGFITLNDAYDLCGLTTKTFSNYFDRLHS